MKKDQFKTYTEKHRDELDTDALPNGMWDAIEQELDEKNKLDKTAWWKPALIGAASAAVLLTSGYWALQSFQEADGESALAVAEYTQTDSLETIIEQQDFDRAAFKAEKDGKPMPPAPPVTERNIFYNSAPGAATYSWDFGNANQQSAGNQGTGVYDVIVTDANGSSIASWDYRTPQIGEFQKTPFGEQQRNEVGLNQWQDRAYTDAYFTTEYYTPFSENEFLPSLGNPLSTFGIDVDRAGYSNVRRMVNQQVRPPADAVKIEELVNYFHYDYPQPQSEHPFEVSTEIQPCPWNPQNRLLRIGIKGEEVDHSDLPASNLVFLIDVSGSMEDRDKLPLLKEGFRMLVNQLREKDRVSIVVYAGSSGVVLPSTSGIHKEKIMEAIDRLNAGGSTAGGEGIVAAYKQAKANFIEGGNNRVILATDGDFNVGVSDEQGLVNLIERERESGVFLSVLGFGTGNLQSGKMEQLADNGNGNYSYIDNHNEAKKVLVTEMGGTLLTIAKDVKLQVEFNPVQVKSYRLLGYENRVMAAEDFDNDLKDAGDLGAGHTVTALYEIVPANWEEEAQDLTDLKYQQVQTDQALTNEIMTLKLRYKKPAGTTSILLSHTMTKTINPFMSKDFAFAAAVAEFGLIMRNSAYRSNANFKNVLRLAYFGKGEDPNGYRAEFIEIVRKAQLLLQPS